MVSVSGYHFHGYGLEFRFGFSYFHSHFVSTLCITVLSCLLSPVLFWKAFPHVSSPAVHSPLFCAAHTTVLGFTSILWVIKLNLCIEVAVPPSVITRRYPSPIFLDFAWLSDLFIYFLLCPFGLCLPLLYRKTNACLNALLSLWMSVNIFEVKLLCPERVCLCPNPGLLVFLTQAL